MFGIRGLDAVGLVHTLLGLTSVMLGLFVVLMPKGTALHRRIGLFYTLCMLLLNLTALGIYDLFGGFGPFHALALVSLGTIGAGVVPVWLRRPRGWLELHARFMSWSYAGLLAAFFAEIGARLPGVGFTAGVLIPTVGVSVAAAFVIHRRVPGLVARFGLLMMSCLTLAQTGHVLAQGGPVGTVTVELTGFKNAAGTARVALVEPHQFLQDSAAIRVQSASIRDGRATFVFERVPYGSYAIQAYHDVNGNRKLDRGLFGMPKEPYGFSNNARSAFGPPAFDEARVQLSAGALIVAIVVR